MKTITRLLMQRAVAAARPYVRAYGLLQTAKVFNRSALVWNPGAERVMVLAPHMDDEVIGCGGALARHVAAGATVAVVFLTDGSLGGAATDGPGVPDLVATRRREAAAALGELAISRLSFLDAKDGELRSTPALATALRATLEANDPELVYLPSFLEEHPDHRAATQLLLDAVNGTNLRFSCLGYEVWTPLFPNCLVRIDEVADLKRRAIECYRSQLTDSDYVHTQLGLNAYRSSAFLGGSCRYAEAYCAMSLDTLRETYGLHCAAAGRAT